MAIDLSQLKKTKIINAPRIMIYGRPGIGKSSFAAEAPDVVVLNVEGGLENIECYKFPQDRKLAHYEEATDFLNSLLTQEHQFKTLGIDTADWLEKLIHEKVARDNNVASIENIPYGAGYVYALEIWRDLFRLLDRLRNEKGMAIIIVAHADVKKHNNPMGENYDCYIPKLHGSTNKGDSALGVMIEWVDAVLFAGDRIYTKSEQAGMDKNKKIHKAVSSELVLYTSPNNPAFRAKNRYNLPAELSFTKGSAWQGFYNAFITGVNTGVAAQPTTNQQQ